LNQEASSGEVKVLPLLVGSAAEIKEILGKYPLLNDKRYLPWDGDLNAIVDAMLSRLGRHQEAPDPKAVGPSKSNPYIPLPKLKKKFTQRDKDLFLRNSFTVVKQFVEHGLEELKKRNPEVDIDLAEVTKFKFVSTIYVNGEIAARCKIWIGGLSTSDSIAYLEGQSQMESDNSFNELLSIATNDEGLGFKPLGTWFGTDQYTQDYLLTMEQAAEHIWRRFTKPLE